MIIFLFDFAPVKIRVLRGNTFFLDVFFEILDSELTWQYLTVGFHLNRRPGLVSLWTRRHLRFLVKDGDTHTFPSFIEKSNDHSLLKCQSLNYNVVDRVLLHLPFLSRDFYLTFQLNCTTIIERLESLIRYDNPALSTIPLAICWTTIFLSLLFIFWRAHQESFFLNVQFRTISGNMGFVFFVFFLTFFVSGSRAHVSVAKFRAGNIATTIVWASFRPNAG